VRDVVGNEVPLVLRQGEPGLSAAFAGASAALVVAARAGAQPPALRACAGVTFLLRAGLLRAGSMAFGWKRPVCRSRPPRA
jgi:uncharacterized membrane protein YeiH